MLVYILSIMKGLHMCIHLKNGKTWSTLRAVPIHRKELMHRCDIHLMYFGFGIYLRLVKQPHPIPQHTVVGTIQCDNPDVLNKLLLGKQEHPKKKHLKKAASAAAGSQVDLPTVEQELRIATSGRQQHKNHSTTQDSNVCQTIILPNRSVMVRGQKPSEPSDNLDLPFSLLTSTTDKVTTQTTPEDTSFFGTTVSALPGTLSPKFEKPDHNVPIPSTSLTGQVREHNLRKCSVSILPLTTEVIMKYTRATVVKPKATVSHSKDPTSTKHTDQWHTVPKCKISGHPQSNKHVFHVKRHILRKRKRKTILKMQDCKLQTGL